MRVSLVGLAAFVVVAACGGKIDAPSDGGVDSPVMGKCCPPDAAPGCCMNYGGWSDDGTCRPAVCDGMPVPSADWKLGTDAHGCSYWVQPTGGPICGAPPPPSPDDAGPPPTCPAPADVSGFVPKYKPTKTNPTGCTAAQLDAIYQDCYSYSSNGTQCASDHSTMAACVSCLESKEADATWGPLVVTTGIVTLNIGGCVALATGSTTCAEPFEDTFECELAACEAQCPVTDASSFQDYEKCIMAADAGGCAKYAPAKCGLADAGAAQCDITTFQQGFMDYGKLFCGGN